MSPNDVGITFKLHKLLHVPSILKNLLSVSQFAKDNSVFFEFHPHVCLVSQETNKILLKGDVSADGLYSFHNLKLQDSPSLLMSASTVSNVDSPSSALTVNNNSSTVISNFVSSSLSVANLWHARLGHPNDHVMKIVLTHCNIASLNKNSTGFCASCCMGRSHRLPSHNSTSVYSPLELIFTNLWGPSHIPSYSGYKNYVSFIDAFSRYTWIFPIKSKAETISVFQAFKYMVELQLNSKIKIVQSDWGGEYRPFSTLLASFGVSHRLTCPHTHHQNGVVERKHRHIVDLGLTLLHHASLPLQFWDYAFTTIVYLINRLPTSSLKFAIPCYFV